MNKRINEKRMLSVNLGKRHELRAVNPKKIEKNSVTSFLLN